mmetsp:Transcript_37340/g.36938  ORF Transcript_37340/g.36938 Transcript_37340/m.36938 type:complete len:102 (-) Transcript_37340:40-345(-)
MVLELYTTQDQQKNPFSCVKYLDDQILKGFPPMKIIIAEVDAIRDEMFRFAVRCLKNGVRVELQVFRHQFHGFIGHSDLPEERNMTPVGLKQIVENVMSEF